MTFKEWVFKKFDDFKKTKFYNRIKEKTRKFAIKLGIICIIIVLLYIGYLLMYPWLKKLFLEFLKLHPTLNAISMHFYYQIANWTGLGLLYLSFMGSVFFLPIPIEVPVIQFINHHYNIFLIILFATLGSVLGLLFNYLFGLVAGKRLLKYFLKDNYEKMKGWVDKYGAFFLFFGALLPLPIEPVCLVYGAVRYPIKKFIIYTGIGRVIKVILIYFLLGWIITAVIPYLRETLPGFIVSLLNI